MAFQSKIWPNRLTDLRRRLLAVPRWGLNFLLPPRCMACGDLTHDAHQLCATCWGQMQFISQPFCDACALPLEGDLASDSAGPTLCGACLTSPPPYSKSRAAVVYDDHSRPLILRLKHGDQTHLARGLARWLQRSGVDLLATNAPVLVPVPLHWRRRLLRRYNQAALVALHLSKLSGCPVCVDGLLRAKHTPSQGGLSHKGRERNVQGAFKINPKRQATLKGKTIILLDDVYTTGATLSACSKVLLKAGAKDVQTLTLARVNRGEVVS